MFKFLNKKEQGWFDLFVEQKPNHIYFKKLAIDHAIDLIARTVSKSEINFFQNIDGTSKKVKDELYYKLNIQPNPKQTGTDFMYELVDTLFRDGNVLVVPKGEHLYIAYSFEIESKLDGYIYKNVKVVDVLGEEFELKETYTSEDVMHLHLKNSQVTNVLDSFYREFAEMMNASVNGFKDLNYRKYIFHLPNANHKVINAKTGERVEVDEYVKTIAGSLFDDSNSAIGLPATLQLEPIDKRSALNEQVEDYIKLLQAYADSVAMAFNIPLDVYYGRQTERADGMSNFLTFAVMPIIEIIEDGLNSTFISKSSYLKDEGFRFNTFSMRHFDIMEISNSMDKLFAIGWSHNDLREIMGLPRIEDEFANDRYVTKNYMSLKEAKEEKEENEVKQDFYM